MSLATEYSTKQARKFAGKMVGGFCTLLAYTSPSQALSQDPNAPFEVAEFAYLNHARSFEGELTLKAALEPLQNAGPLDEHALWRSIGHEAWKRSHASSVFELMSEYAHGHLSQTEGRPAITFQAYRTSDVPAAFKDRHMVLATITVFGLLDDSI